jgi:tRNA(Ile)-lysidine synthase
LRQAAEEYGGEIYTAHHQDDLLESVIINILRGTGWRGLAPLGDLNIKRPLLKWSKGEIYKYAAEHGVNFRQDQTNTQEDYLRNRVRERIGTVRLEGQKEMLAEVVNFAIKQREIGAEIDRLLEEIVPVDGRYEREWFDELDVVVAREILRAGLLRAGRRVTRPQLERFLLAIQDYASGKSFNLPGDYLVRFSKDSFVIK